MIVLNSRQIYEAECAQVRAGISFTRLMENAGSACARVIRERFEPLTQKAQPVCVVCGSGKNGGDGFVVARKLALAGFNTAVILALGEPTAEDSRLMREKLNDIDMTAEFSFGSPEAAAALKKAAVIVDAVFGTGYHYRDNPLLHRLFQAINEAPGKVVSIDLPSGLESDSGALPPCCVCADITVAVSCLKPAHVLKPALCRCGETVVVDIGLSRESLDSVGGVTLAALSLKEASSIFPKRDVMGHKGVFGHALSVCGSKNMQGAAVLAATGALRSGAGLVTAAFPEAAYSPIAAKLTEPLLLPLPSNTAGTLSVGALPALLEYIKKADAVLVGCGLGLNLDTSQLVCELVRSCTKPLILDADGINAVAENINILKEAKAPLILTPHPGEMERLTGLRLSEPESDRVDAALGFANEYNAVLLLKGASTVVASPGGRRVYINTTGNPGMAKGGSGDLLSGIILSLLARGLTPFDSAVLGAYIHGAAGDAAAVKLSAAGMTPADCAAQLPVLLKKLE